MKFENHFQISTTAGTPPLNTQRKSPRGVYPENDYIDTMSDFAKRALVLMPAILVCAGAHATKPDSDGHSYDIIPERNVFNLKPETPRVLGDPLPPQPTAQAKLILSGISTITGYKLALLKAQLPGKPGEAPREQSLM